MELIKEGTYTAKIVNYGIGTTQKGDPQVMIKLAFKDDANQAHTLTWFGGFGEKSIKHTLKALCVCGLTGEVDALADGLPSGALDTEKELSIEVEHNDYQGKVSARVKWINLLNGGAFKSLMERKDVRAKLGGLNVKGELAAIRQETGIKEERRTAPVAEEQPSFEDQDVGF